MIHKIIFSQDTQIQKHSNKYSKKLDWVVHLIRVMQSIIKIKIFN
jgi:hypothetical protein